MPLLWQIAPRSCSGAIHLRTLLLSIRSQTVYGTVELRSCRLCCTNCGAE
jgi:hypothetical protein